jgi:hypothetical protein
MIAGGNWWRVNEIVMRHLTRRLETRYRCRDKANQTAKLPLAARPAQMVAIDRVDPLPRLAKSEP